jgi:hypothetical protein
MSSEQGLPEPEPQIYQLLSELSVKHSDTNRALQAAYSSPLHDGAKMLCRPLRRRLDERIRLMSNVRLGCRMPTEIEEFGQLLVAHSFDLSEEDLTKLIFDFEFGEPEITTGADELISVVLVPQLSSRFENLLSALRAGDRDSFVQCLTSMRLGASTAA